MNPEMEDLATQYVLDRLNAVERLRFETELERDAELAQLVRALEAGYASAVAALPGVTPSTETLAGIEAELDRLQAQSRGAAEGHRFSWFSPALGWGLAAVLAIALTAGAVTLGWRARSADRLIVVVASLGTNGSSLDELKMPTRGQGPDERFVQLARLAETYWEHPDQLPTATKVAGLGRAAYAVFDPESSQGFVGLRQLPPLDRGLRYHLWLVEARSGEVRDAGALPALEQNQGLYFFAVNPAVSSKADAQFRFFVTAEDATGAAPKRPRGNVVLGDRI